MRYQSMRFWGYPCSNKKNERTHANRWATEKPTTSSMFWERTSEMSTRSSFQKPSVDWSTPGLGKGERERDPTWKQNPLHLWFPNPSETWPVLKSGGDIKRHPSFPIFSPGDISPAVWPTATVLGPGRNQPPPAPGTRSGICTEFMWAETPKLTLLETRTLNIKALSQQKNNVIAAYTDPKPILLWSSTSGHV